MTAGKLCLLIDKKLCVLTLEQKGEVERGGGDNHLQPCLRSQEDLQKLAGARAATFWPRRKLGDNSDI